MSASEHTRRLEALRERLEELDADAAYVSSPANIAYLSGVRIIPHERLIALLLPREGDPRLVVPALEGEASRNNPAGVAVLEWKDEDGPFGALEAAFDGSLPGNDAPRLVLEKDVVTVGLLEGLRERVGVGAAGDVAPVLRELRMAKSAAEVALIAEATRWYGARVPRASRWRRSCSPARPAPCPTENRMPGRSARATSSSSTSAPSREGTAPT